MSDRIHVPTADLTPEQAKLGAKLDKRRRIVNLVWARLGAVRALLAVIGVAWLFALPHPALWKHTFIDEHALQPAQVTIYYDWAQVFRADRYLAEVEALRDANATWAERADFLCASFGAAGVSAGNTTSAVFAHVTPPRSEGTEAILVSANWLSRNGEVNVRGVALLLSLAEFLRAQNYWAFDIFLVTGDGYLDGLNDFTESYASRANIWTALNIDYPYHSFSHLGVFFEGTNGRLPNQDAVNSVLHVAKYGVWVDSTIHDLDERPQANYRFGAKALLDHFKYMALGRPSAAHGLLAKHRIDAVTMYGVPAEGPHGFHTMGRMVESTLRAYNNLLERLHASFFFYLLPHPDYFLPVGHYLPAAVLLGASVTLGGFDCPDPLAGALWALPAFALGLVGWVFQSSLVSVGALLLPKPKGDARASLASLAHLFYGALIPTLAMVNFPQAVLLAALVIVALAPLPRWARAPLVFLHPALLEYYGGIDLRAEWLQFGNVAWPAIFAIWIPLQAVSDMISV
ncbi:Glycosyl phosphatidyl inositol protein transamidase complex subunit [Vanrija albida]|uniref:Glycosyl phosphatidyl inositol protein transamidase complex subunit n=1 Tax=Vanrija albida TaxID=181172 RepID=A0ABR3Q2E7_9TREE